MHKNLTQNGEPQRYSWGMQKKKKKPTTKTVYSVNTITNVLHHTYISRISDQKGVSLLYIMLEIHHSGREPSIYGYSLTLNILLSVVKIFNSSPIPVRIEQNITKFCFAKSIFLSSYCCRQRKKSKVQLPSECIQEKLVVWCGIGHEELNTVTDIFIITVITDAQLLFLQVQRALMISSSCLFLGVSMLIVMFSGLMGICQTKRQVISTVVGCAGQ